MKLKPSTALLGVLLGAVTALVPATSAAAAEPKNLQVMSWNMCGSQRASWGCAGTGTPQNKIDVVKYHVTESFVQAALLQEGLRERPDAADEPARLGLEQGLPALPVVRGRREGQQHVR